MCVCVCGGVRPAEDHRWLPGHGGGRPAVRQHRGLGWFLLGGESDAARVRPALSHGR